MKIYSIAVTIIAIFALILAGYVYWRAGDLRKDFKVCQDQNEGLLKDKALLKDQANAANGQLEKIAHSAIVLKTVLNSFMYAGDIRALTVGSKEAVEVEEAIGNLDDDKDRMMTEGSWSEFKETRYFNPLFGLLRNLANNIDKNTTLFNNLPLDN